MKNEPWRDYSEKLAKERLQLHKDTIRIKGDTQILVYEVESYLEIGNLDKVKELLTKITKINQY